MRKERSVEGWSDGLPELVVSWHDKNAKEWKYNQRDYVDYLALQSARLARAAEREAIEARSRESTASMISKAFSASAQSMARNAAAGGIADLAGPEAPSASGATTGGVRYAMYNEKDSSFDIGPVYIAFGPGQSFADESSAFAEAKRLYLATRERMYGFFANNRAQIQAVNDRINAKAADTGKAETKSVLRP